MGIIMPENGSYSAANAPPGHETLAAHARATVEADGAERAEKRDAMAKAIAEVEGGRIYAEQMTRRGMVPRWTLFRPHADAIRAWEGREL